MEESCDSHKIRFQKYHFKQNFQLLFETHDEQKKIKIKKVENLKTKFPEN